MAAQHRLLVPEHEQLSIPRQVPAEPGASETEYPARWQVDDLEQYTASQPSPRPGRWRGPRPATQSIIWANRAGRERGNCKFQSWGEPPGHCGRTLLNGKRQGGKGE